MKMRGIAAAAALLAVIGLGSVWWLSAGHGPTLGGPFRLTDQHGRTVTDRDFRGRLMLIYFGYTFCPDVCPTTLATVANAYDRLTPAERAAVVPIFITIDPARDTVAQLAGYVADFSPALVGLTGAPEALAPVLRAYKVYAVRVPDAGGGYAMDHSSILYLMGRDGRLAALFTHATTADELVAGIRKAL